MIHKTARIGAHCVACGNCAKYCPLGVISIHKGLCAKVDESQCKACGKCVLACPADIIEYVKKEGASA